MLPAVHRRSGTHLQVPLHKLGEASGSAGGGASDASWCPEPPENLCCPITLQLFRDPAVVNTGFSYERSAIERHWRNEESAGNRPTCPKTRLRCTRMKLITNWALRAAVEHWLEQQPSDFVPDGWDSRELLPTPRRRSSANDELGMMVDRMKEQVAEMETLARDCAREAVAGRDVLAALHLWQRRSLKYLTIIIVIFGAFCSFLLSHVALHFILKEQTTLVWKVMFTICCICYIHAIVRAFLYLRDKAWLCHRLEPLLMEVTQSRSGPHCPDRHEQALRHLYSTELVDSIDGSSRQ